jgi:GNAT superfamily N-acetyltransferase
MTPEFVAVMPTRLESALDLMQRLYIEAGGEHDRPRARHAMEWLFAHPEAGGAWFIQVDGEIAGYLAITSCFSLEFGGAFGLLDELYLLEVWRGKRLGVCAIEFAEAWCRSRGMDALRLEVEHGNERALRLYHRSGFVSHGRDLMTKWIK